MYAFLRLFLKISKGKHLFTAFLWETSEITHIANQGKELEGIKFPKQKFNKENEESVRSC